MWDPNITCCTTVHCWKIKICIWRFFLDINPVPNSPLSYHMSLMSVSKDEAWMCILNECSLLPLHAVRTIPTCSTKSLWLTAPHVVTGHKPPSSETIQRHVCRTVFYWTEYTFWDLQCLWSKDIHYQHFNLCLIWYTHFLFLIRCFSLKTFIYIYQTPLSTVTYIFYFIQFIQPSN